MMSLRRIFAIASVSYLDALRNGKAPAQYPSYHTPQPACKPKQKLVFCRKNLTFTNFLMPLKPCHFTANCLDLATPSSKNVHKNLIDMVGLNSAGKRPLKDYSKGMARRIGLAVALINDPELLILDQSNPATTTIINLIGFKNS